MTKTASSPMTDSRYNMWRAIFAVAHADNVISPEEEKFMRETLSKFEFSETQRQQLEQDMKVKSEPGEHFDNISVRKDRSDFFEYARLIVWCDGDFDEQEQEIMARLKQHHLRNLDPDEMIKEIRQTFDDKEQAEIKEKMREMYFNLQKDVQETGGMMGAVVRRMWEEEETD
ncbi:MAG: hypothetical protein CMH28_04550 [Micavibrio sp.]|nr:hypothetical protein [Micavibrio sp.]